MKISHIQLDMSKHTLIYLIADIHANLPALLAVLQDIPQKAVILCAGDIVGYYLEPNEVCELLKKKSVLCVQGNHDKYVLGQLQYNNEQEKKYRVQFTQKILHERNFAWLATLPDLIILEIFDKKRAARQSITSIQITHGSPRNTEEYIYADTPLEFSLETKSKFLILGHTHHPMLRNTPNFTIINPGSVGQPRDKIPGACYAIFDLKTQKICFKRAQYPIDNYQQLLTINNIDSNMIKILSRILT